MTVLRTLELLRTLSPKIVSPLIAEAIVGHANMDDASFLQALDLGNDGNVVCNEQTVESFCRLVTMTACLDYLESTRRELVRIALGEAEAMLQVYPDVYARLEGIAASFSYALPSSLDEGALRRLLDFAEETVAVTWTPPTKAELEALTQRLWAKRQ